MRKARGTPLISRAGIKKELKLAYKKARRKIPSHNLATLLLLGQQMSRQVALAPPNRL
jgi:hypothetical protein